MLIFNIQQASEIRICLWCGKFFINPGALQKYCSPKCSKYANQENNRIRQKRFTEKYNLKRNVIGTSNLTGNPKPTFEEELKIVEKEMKRLGITDWVV